MFTKNKLTMDSLAEAVKKVMKDEESGLRMAAHAAHKSGKKMFTFQGKTYPVKVQGEEVSAGDAIIEDKDCVTKPEAKSIAKKEVKGHEKQHHGEKGDVAKHEKKMHKEETFKDRLIESAYGKKSPMIEDDDSSMTPAQKKKKEKIVLSMKDKEKEFKAKYGKNWKSVMYATATKLAMKEDFDPEQIDEISKETKKDFKDRQERLAAASAQTAKDPARLARLSKIPGYTAAMDLAKKTTQKEEVELDEEGSHEGRYSKGDKVIAHSSLTGPREGVVTQVTHDGQRVKVKHGTGAKSISFSYPPHKLKKQTNEEFEELDEKNKSHTHAAHYENDKGEWTGMNLLVAKDDEDAIRQAHEKCKEGCRLSRVERHIPVKEEVEQIDEVGDTEKGRQALTKLVGARVQNPTGKHGLEGVKRALKRLGPARRLNKEEDEPPFEPDKKKSPVDVTDKSGSHHSAMSRVRHLAKQALEKQKKMKKEMIGKAGMTSEERDEE